MGDISPSGNSGTQALSIRWLCHFQHMASKVMRQWEKVWRMVLREFSWARPGIHPHYFCLHFIGRDAVTWPHLTARAAGKCGCPGGRGEGFVQQLASLCQEGVVFCVSLNQFLKAQSVKSYSHNYEPTLQDLIVKRKTLLN